MERGKKGIHSWEKDIKRKEFVLDIGCWNGKRIQSLLGKCRPYGLEIDEKKINLASPKIKKRIFLGDITKKETLNKVIKKKFDRIFLGEVLEHLEEDELALKNINFLLKKGGKLIITTPKSTPFLEFIDPAWILWKLRLGERHHHYAQKEIEEKLKRNGFKIKEELKMGGFHCLCFRWINSILKNIFKSKRKFICEKKEGFLGLEILAIKK